MITDFHKPLLGAAFCLAAALAMAQGTGGNTSTLGNAKAGARLLSYDELSACLKQRDDLLQRKPRLESERSGLDRERAELQQIDESLKADEAAMQKVAQSADDISRRTKELQQQIADYNERRAKVEVAPLSGPTGDRQLRNLERDRATLDKSAADLEAERAAIGPNAEQMVKTFKARADMRNQAAEAWNKRNRELTRKLQTLDVDQEAFTSDCEGRPYREDDEKALKAGK